MAPVEDRTAAFTAIRETPLSSFTDTTARSITHTVAVPGLNLPAAKGGGPLTVERTYTISEIEHDWVSVIVDYEFGDDPTVYGNHPMAVGPLRELLPHAIPQKPFPKARRAARDMIVSMLAQHDLGGWVIMPVIDGNTLEIRPPHFDTSLGSIESRTRRWRATIVEYLPFQADIWWDDDNDVLRVHPVRDNEGNRIVRTS